MVQGLDRLYYLYSCSIEVEGEEVDEPTVKRRCEDKCEHLFHVLGFPSHDLGPCCGRCAPEEELIPVDSFCLEL